MTAIGIIMNFITRVYSLELLQSQWCGKYRTVVHSIVLPNIQTNKDLLSLSDREAPGCWVFEPPPASQSGAILGENTKLKTLHLPIQKANSHNCLPTLWIWFTYSDYLLEYMIGKRKILPICEQIYVCLLPLISHECILGDKLSCKCYN